MSVQELSEKLGITLESLREILDERAMPSPGLIKRIGSLFGAGQVLSGGTEAPLPITGSATDDFEFPIQSGATRNEEALLSAKLKASGGQAAAGSGRPGPGPRNARLRRRKKLDLAELAARHQALFNLLLDKKVITRDEYQMSLEIIKAKILQRRGTSKAR